MEVRPAPVAAASRQLQRADGTQGQDTVPDDTGDSARKRKLDVGWDMEWSD